MFDQRDNILCQCGKKSKRKPEQLNQQIQDEQ